MGVEWKHSALEQLSDIHSRPGMSPAAWESLVGEVGRIRTELSGNPLSLGESREAGHRIWFVDVLVVGFQVLNDDDVVITHVAALRGLGG